jgi:FkbM family methyltransferase
MFPVIHSGQLLFEERQHGIYTVLPFMKPGLMLDIGAAAGHYTRLVLSMSPESRVMAFEPFAGNFPHFEQNIKDDPRVKLVRKAVANTSGEVKFFVSSTVKGTEPGWEKMVGYSSLGRIVDDAHPRAGDAPSMLACRLDDEVDEHVRFCKIDVQGGELGVFLGAERLIASHGVDVFFVEFNGEEEILQFLFSRGYIFFDSMYLLVAKKRKPDPSCWGALCPVKLSTGVEAYNGWAKSSPRDFPGYCQWLLDQGRQIGGVWTDMVCVHRSFLPEFLRAAAAALSQPTGSADEGGS